MKGQKPCVEAAKRFMLTFTLHAADAGRMHGKRGGELTWEAFAQMVTGVKREMAVATCTNAACAGLALSRQLSGRCGQPIQMCACGSHSAGIWKPSAAAKSLLPCVIA